MHMYIYIYIEEGISIMVSIIIETNNSPSFNPCLATKSNASALPNKLPSP
jgi:hypothetical protein